MAAQEAVTVDIFYLKSTTAAGLFPWKSGKKSQKDSAIQQRKKFPEKIKARDIVNKAIKSGKLIRMPCLICGETKVEGHHEDYDKPLDVDWLCQKHHREQEEINKGV